MCAAADAKKQFDNTTCFSFLKFWDSDGTTEMTNVNGTLGTDHTCSFSVDNKMITVVLGTDHGIRTGAFYSY